MYETQKYQQSEFCERYIATSYNEAKKKFKEYLSYKDRPIILFGKGGTGKTFLVRDMQNLGIMHSGWNYNPEFLGNGNTLQLNNNFVYEANTVEDIAHINCLYYLIDMNPLGTYKNKN